MVRNLLTRFTFGLAACLLLTAAACGSPASGPVVPSVIVPSATYLPENPQHQQPVSQGASATASPTDAPSATSPEVDCTPAANITTSDLGNTICVTGTVKRAYA